MICTIVSVREEQEEGMQALMQRLSRISTSDCDLLEAPLSAQQPAAEAPSAPVGGNEFALGGLSGLSGLSGLGGLGGLSNGGGGGFLGLESGASFAASSGNPFAAGIPWAGTPQSKPIPVQPPPTPNSQSPLTSPTCSMSTSLAQQLDALPCMNPNVSFPDAIAQPQSTQDIFFGAPGAPAASSVNCFASGSVAMPGPFTGVSPLVSPVQNPSPLAPSMQTAAPLPVRVANALNPLAEQQSSAHRALSIEQPDAFDALKQQQQLQTRVASEPPPDQSGNPDSTSNVSDMCL